MWKLGSNCRVSFITATFKETFSVLKKTTPSPSPSPSPWSTWTSSPEYFFGHFFIWALFWALFLSTFLNTFRTSNPYSRISFFLIIEFQNIYCGQTLSVTTVLYIVARCYNFFAKIAQQLWMVANICLLVKNWKCHCTECFMHLLLPILYFHFPTSLNQFWSSVELTSFFMVQKEWYAK